MPEEENQVRRQNAQVFALHQLQNGLHLHASGKETQSAQGVWPLVATMLVLVADTVLSAKYIEGLENRLGRMESLLKLSGLLSADDGHTDLGTLEKRLADKAAANNHSEQARPSTGDAKAESGGQSDVASQNGTATETQSQSHTETSRDQEQSKRSSVSSPKAQKQADQEVEHVAELMCSLVTNNYGETRFIGEPWVLGILEHLITVVQAHPQVSRYSRQRVFNGSTKRLATIPSKR